MPLSDVGVAQADAAGPAVAALSPSRIVTSDLSRARLAAGAWAGRPIRVEVDARFREIHAGAWQGLAAQEVAQGWPELRAAALRGEDVRRRDDGETMGDVLARVGEALDRLLSDLPAGSAPWCPHTGRLRGRWRRGCSISTSRWPGACSAGSATATGVSCVGAARVDAAHVERVVRGAVTVRFRRLPEADLVGRGVAWVNFTVAPHRGNNRKGL